MSVKNALQFIQQFRRDETLKLKVLGYDSGPELESFVNVGAEMGLVFTVEDLTVAHKYDWKIRWLLYKQNLESDR